MTRTWSLPYLLVVCAGLLAFPPPDGDEQDRLPVGLQPDGRIVVPTNQILKPAGTQITFPGRPVDLAFLDDGKTLVVKNMRNLVFIDVAAAEVKQTLALPKDRSFGVVGLLVRGRTRLRQRCPAGPARRPAAGGRAFPLGQADCAGKAAVGGKADPAGIARLSDSEILGRHDARQQRPARRPRRPARSRRSCPSASLLMDCRRPARPLPTSATGAAIRRAKAIRRRRPPARRSASIRVPASPTTAASPCSAARTGKWKQLKTIPVGLHPCGMVASTKGRFLYVANANSDTVSVIDTQTERSRRNDRLPARGAAAVRQRLATPLALSPDGGTLYVANGTNNCVAVVRLGAGSSEGDAAGRPEAARRRADPDRLVSRRRAACRPTARQLFVANVKGHGSLEPAAARREGQELARPPRLRLDHRRARRRAAGEVHRDRSTPTTASAYSLAGLEKPRPDARPVPVPRAARRAVGLQARHLRHQGEPHLRPGLRRHEGGQRRPEAVHLRRGGDAEPPQALARAVHAVRQLLLQRRAQRRRPSWVNEAYVTDYLEKAFGSFTRSYPDDGSDPLAFAADRLPLGQRPGAQEDLPQLRRVRREDDLRAEGRDLDRLSTPTTRTAPRKVKIDAEAEHQDAGAVHAPRLPVLPAHGPRRLPGASCSSRT